jgi:hypothetical protein
MKPRVLKNSSDFTDLFQKIGPGSGANLRARNASNKKFEKGIVAGRASRRLQTTHESHEDFTPYPELDRTPAYGRSIHDHGRGSLDE